MKKEKIFELRIEEDDPISGIDSISLVSEPAIELNWVAFKKVTNQEDFHVPDGEDEKYVKMFEGIGQPEQELLDEGWELTGVEEVTQHKFGLSTEPNAISDGDSETKRVRYKYGLDTNITGQGAIINTTREYCRVLINRNYVFRIEDIQSLTPNSDPDDGGFGGAPILFRGGYNCRHRWFKMTYEPTGKIINKASVNINKVKDVAGRAPSENTPWYQPSLITEKTRNAVSKGTASDNTKRNLGLSKEKFGYPMFETKEEAEEYAILIGCEGSHEHKIGDTTLYMPCEEHPEDLGYDVGGLPSYVDQVETGKTKNNFETYNDYPESARNNACKVLRWRDEHGDEVKGMTQVGWTRANQLCKGENISEETIARMSAFQRHRKNAEVSAEFKSTPWKDAGYVAWLGWGGTTGIEWASRKLESIRRKKMCKESFTTDEEKRIVIGPAMIPYKNIFRKDDKGNPYWVYFTPETISMIAEKYMKNKFIDNNDTDHNGKAADDVYVYESWIKEDENDKSNKYGYEDTPIGTWFVSMKIKNDEVWERVKNKELNGFSVSGFFEEVEQFKKEKEFLRQVAELLKGL